MADWLRQEMQIKPTAEPERCLAIGNWTTDSSSEADSFIRQNRCTANKKKKKEKKREEASLYMCIVPRLFYEHFIDVGYIDVGLPPPLVNQNFQLSGERAVVLKSWFSQVKRSPLGK